VLLLPPLLAPKTLPLVPWAPPKTPLLAPKTLLLVPWALPKTPLAKLPTLSRSDATVASATGWVLLDKKAACSGGFFLGVPRGMSGTTHSTQHTTRHKKAAQQSGFFCGLGRRLTSAR
jgi:hypothetical protein